MVSEVVEATTVPNPSTCVHDVDVAVSTNVVTNTPTDHSHSHRASTASDRSLLTPSTPETLVNATPRAAAMQSTSPSTPKLATSAPSSSLTKSTSTTSAATTTHNQSSESPSSAVATSTPTATNMTSVNASPTANTTTTTSVAAAAAAAAPAAVDFEPPLACIRRILKHSLPSSTNVGKDASAAFARACGIFIIYLTACANDYARFSKRQTITANDVLAAVKELEFDEFTPTMQAFLANYRATEKNKKDAKAKQRIQLAGVGDKDNADGNKDMRKASSMMGAGKDDDDDLEDDEEEEEHDDDEEEVEEIHDVVGASTVAGKRVRDDLDCDDANNIDDSENISTLDRDGKPHAKKMKIHATDTHE